MFMSMTGKHTGGPPENTPKLRLKRNTWREARRGSIHYFTHLKNNSILCVQSFLCRAPKHVKMCS